MSRSEKDHYKTLGADENASADAIKKKYRTLASESHPDSPISPDEAKFKEVGEAYDILRDPTKRAEYDRRRAQRKTDAAALKRTEQAAAGRQRREQERSANDAERFDERIRGQSGGERRASTPKASPSASPWTSAPPFTSPPPPHQQSKPMPASPLWHAAPERPPKAAAPPVTIPRKKLGDAVLRLVFLGAPIGIMALVIPAKNAHPSLFLDVISVVCFFWLMAGIAGLFIEW